MAPEQVDERFKAALDERAADVAAIVEFITAHPELAHEEVESSEHLVARLRDAGYSVTTGVAGMPTAFRAELVGGAPGSTVGVVAVYDAVAAKSPEGDVAPVHSCGHGAQSGGVIGAALALAAVRDELSGTVVIVGCPADEIHSPRTRELGSGKALSAARGLWDDIDVALYPHPEFIDTVWPSSLWMRRESVRIVGIRTLKRDVVSSPLDALAVIARIPSTFDPARLMVETVLLDGDVEESAGMVIDASFLLFADTEQELDALAAELRGQFGEGTWSSSAAIAEVRPDAAVTALVADAFAAAGRDFIADPPALGFATDFGNVTQVVRAAIVGVGREEGWRYHTPTGGEEFAGPAGTRNALDIAEVIGLAALRIGAARDL
ncbi:M20/M25/M40 family metallo-hydrolase [Herbiconiux sp. KACC 21604]|uniref:M20/M25/M40 family metallo-hydrolase n=1 Tax=unclassified Herbiconiux TaxID=2618217 RepID=UPI0014926FD9|nr:M20/M25/M40 family metallo-hydrolase [Herbiconiux sp. SALV-R1]QJU54755.1 M20/M25/M40 family metallo-hydrolase [Herbiconiux sp. SALV-R1]WPO85863.1 M20/M25/M40 family metallo-hydrolase [Herbiconiux sp. KACC 21604]